VRCHGGQAQGGAQADAVNGHLAHAARRSAGVSPRAFTLSANCSTSIFSWLSSASRAAKYKVMAINIRSQIGFGNSFKAIPSMVASSCLRWSSHSSSAIPAFLETSSSSRWATSSSALKRSASSSP
jgi:hypothetical protein